MFKRLKLRYFFTDRALCVLLITALALLYILASWLVTQENAKLSLDSPFSHLYIRGTYSVDGGPEKELREDTRFDLSGHRNIVVTGRLSENVEKKDFVMLRITDLRIRLFRNGTQIYSFGYDRSTSPYVRSPGNVWHFFASPGIAKDDDIRLEISNVYKKVHYSSVNVLLNEMYSGSPDALYRMVFTKHGFSFVVGIFVFFLGLLELCTALLLLFLKRHKTKDLFYGAAFTISSGIWFSIQFDILPLLVPYPAFIGSLDMYGLYFMGIFFTLYISTYTTGRRRMTLMAYSIFQAVSVIFVEARQLAGRIDVYDTSFYGSNILMGALAVSLLALLCERRKRRKTFSTAVLFSVLPVAVGGCLDILFFWGNHYNANLWTRTGFLIFVSVQWGIVVWQFKRNADAAAETDSMERALIQSRVAIMLSQIQPHFLYNALAAIKALCAKDPETAREAITRFSKYLRGNMDSLSHEPLITFDRELAHMKNYLYIEELRFGDDVRVKYDITASRFLIPVLTIQPLVENAIRYGITQKEGGGTITISSAETGSGYLVKVSDDGVGFDPERVNNDDRSHVGIENTRKRLETLCGGSLSVISAVGGGTVVEIFIPKRKGQEPGVRSV